VSFRSVRQRAYMSAENETTPTNTHVPGTRLMIAIVALLVAGAIWTATRRTMPVDDAIVAGGGAAVVDDTARRVGGEQPAGRIAWPDMRIDLNRANGAELALLPGVGDRLADRIIDDRQRNGPFASVDDLQRVPGMGPAIIERLRPHVVVE
jgi:competence ComEA-like helix-hairpin-helix protein